MIAPLPKSSSAFSGAFVIGLFAASLHAQANMQPTNSAPNPYQTVEGWAKMPQGRTWGSIQCSSSTPRGISSPTSARG